MLQSVRPGTGGRRLEISRLEVVCTVSIGKPDLRIRSWRQPLSLLRRPKASLRDAAQRTRIALWRGRETHGCEVSLAIRETKRGELLAELGPRLNICICKYIHVL